MKYQVGDVLFVKNCEYKSRPHLDRRPLLPPRLRPRLLLHPRLHCRPELLNTVGIITEVYKHSDIFESGSTENHNLYFLLSQVDRKEYYFYENEVECEVLK